MELILSYSKCPKCDTIISYIDMISGNTIDGEIWSDGMIESSMFYNVLKYNKCSNCNSFYWLSDNLIKEPENFENINRIEESFDFENLYKPMIDNAIEALQSGVANSEEKEIFIRIKLWQSINNLIRHSKNRSFGRKLYCIFFKSKEEKINYKLYVSYIETKNQNLQKLAFLLQNSKVTEDYLIICEIYRELGCFEDAKLWLKKIENKSSFSKKRLSALRKKILFKNKMVYSY